MLPFVAIRRCDKASSHTMVDIWEVFSDRCCPCFLSSEYEDEYCMQDHHHHPASSSSSSSSQHKPTLDTDIYWDKFSSQCILSTSELLGRGFLECDAIEGMDPACVQSIPSVAVLTVVLDTMLHEDNNGDGGNDDNTRERRQRNRRSSSVLQPGDIYWKVDGTVCKAKGRALLDNVARLLWPMVLDIQLFLAQHEKTFGGAKEANDKTDDGSSVSARIVMQALLCDNHDGDKKDDDDDDDNNSKNNNNIQHQSCNSAIRMALGASKQSEEQAALCNQLRTKIIRLVLALLRVKPFQRRMGRIFQHPYMNGTNGEEKVVEEEADDDLEAQLLLEQDSPTHSEDGSGEYTV